MKNMLLVVGALNALIASAAELKVDFSVETGPIKPVNAVGQPPMIGAPRNYSMLHYLTEAGIPYARLHDVGGAYGSMRYVDIPNIFRDFDADVDDPKSYDFAYTDTLIKALMESGVEPFFRLGVTIENYVEDGLPAYRVDPPKDFSKWAKICEYVIRHYTEGWNNGFKYKITYWEIWNEPDNRPDDECDRDPLWRAPFSEYIRFYGIVSTHLKKCFPHLKIGGYGSCGFYAGVGAGHVKAANSSSRIGNFVKCAHDFLKAARDNRWPLDFFSYHSYSAPEEALRQVRFANDMLDSYGFTAERTERIYDEWLPYVSHDNLGTALQAAGIATELIELQLGPCDLACIYDAKCGVGKYSPLFNPMTYRPHKAYYAFTAFNELRKCGTAVKSTTDGTKGFHACAAKGVKGAAVMLANDTDKAIPLNCDFQGREIVAVRVTDNNRTDVTIPMPDKIPPRSFMVVVFR